MTQLIIKNMVCPRCIKYVGELLQTMGIAYSNIELGVVQLVQPISEEQKHKLVLTLQEDGFELLEDQYMQLIERIKDAVILWVYHHDEIKQTNFSEFISSKLHQDYSSLSKSFSSFEGITIEKYLILQKIERVKELLTYGELTLSEIAYELDYSSSQHLSSQFKRITGFTASEFRKRYTHTRQFIDKV